MLIFSCYLSYDHCQSSTKHHLHYPDITHIIVNILFMSFTSSVISVLSVFCVFWIVFLISLCSVCTELCTPFYFYFCFRIKEEAKPQPAQ